MSQFQITWDGSSPARMTRFWSQALGYKVEGLDHYVDVMTDPEGNEFCIG